MFINVLRSFAYQRIAFKIVTMTYGKVAQLETCCRTELNGNSLTKVKLLTTYGCCAIGQGYLAIGACCTLTTGELYFIAMNIQASVNNHTTILLDVVTFSGVTT